MPGLLTWGLWWVYWGHHTTVYPGLWLGPKGKRTVSDISKLLNRLSLATLNVFPILFIQSESFSHLTYCAGDIRISLVSLRLRSLSSFGLLSSQTQSMDSYSLQTSRTLGLHAIIFLEVLPLQPFTYA